jgi:alanyl-tRNA synthetase
VPAERLYYASAALDFEAEVTDIRLAQTDDRGQLWQVALDKTAFFPEGGGQPWDTGRLVATAPSGTTLEATVERVEEDAAGEVWHYVRKPLMAGTAITGFVDAARRIDHEQQHSGQHLLSAMFFRELNTATVGFHLGADVSTIDLDHTEKFTEDELSRVLTAANRVITDQRPLLTHWVEPEYAQDMLRRGDLRKLPDRPGPIRIIQMQGIEFNACGGTHVQNTAAIGSIHIRRTEKNKKGQRIEFVCGTRATRAAREDFLLLDTIARTLSVGATDIPERIAKLLEERKAAAKEVKRLSTTPAQSHKAEPISQV